MDLMGNKLYLNKTWGGIKMFGYVVLHYQNTEVTEKCVKALLENFEQSPIVIVDNCSPNNSGKLLKQKYERNTRIVVLINDTNSGFARGNNLGYVYIKKEFPVDYIVVMNNDVVIDDIEFQNTTSEFMNDKNVDVCGPDIVTLKKNHQNPLALEPLTTDYLRKRVKRDRIKCEILKNNLVYIMYQKYKMSNVIPIRGKQPEALDCILHGSCVIFGKKFIETENFAFLPITYMYNEEAILYDYLKYKGYITGYCSDSKVLHMEGIATSSRLKRDKNKILFRFKNNTDSLFVQINQREKYLKYESE